jgi:uncharacterized protein with FMN-binding domain
MPRGLVAVSASAVAAIYLAGYLRTQSADASIAAAAVPTLTVGQGAPVAASAPTATPPPAVVQRQAATSVRTAPRSTSPAPATTTGATGTSPAPATTTGTSPGLASGTGTTGSSPATSSASTSAQAAYTDGTYTGQGTSRRGDVWVSVQVQGGRIANVTITRSTLQYPLRDIANLPTEVVQRQSAQVDIVSRATYSSQAFRTAVAQALSAAKNA